MLFKRGWQNGDDELTPKVAMYILMHLSPEEFDEEERFVVAVEMGRLLEFPTPTAVDDLWKEKNLLPVLQRNEEEHDAIVSWYTGFFCR